MTPTSETPAKLQAFYLLVARAHSFTACFWVAIAALGAVAFILFPSADTIMWALAAGALGSIAWLFAYAALWEDASKAWYAHTFDSTPEQALRVIDVGYLSEIISRVPGRRSLATRVLKERFPALPGSALLEIVDRVASQQQNPSITENLVGSDTEARLETTRPGGLHSRLEQSSPRQLASIAGAALGAGLVLVAGALAIVIAAPGNVALAVVAWLGFVGGAALLALRSGLILPARRASWLRTIGTPAAERLLQMGGTSLRKQILAASSPDGAISGSVAVVRRAFPLIGVWDAVAVVRRATATPVSSPRSPDDQPVPAR